MGGLQQPGGDVVENGVAEDMVLGLGGFDIPGGPPDDDGQLRLVVQPLDQAGEWLSMKPSGATASLTRLEK